MQNPHRPTGAAEIGLLSWIHLMTLAGRQARRAGPTCSPVEEASHEVDPQLTWKTVSPVCRRLWNNASALSLPFPQNWVPSPPEKNTTTPVGVPKASAF